ncbi:MAG: hypothetical protein KKH21_16935 [Gammaproteobacteria bacterium]|nr:hypothetical protein [Gammaproteobacteria bacterium]
MRLGQGHPAQLITGLALWFVWLCLVYGGSAVACAVAPPPAQTGPWNWVNGALLALSLVFSVGFLIAAWRSARAAAGLAGAEQGMVRQRFFASAAAVLYGVAAASTVVVALPLLVLAPCV